MALVNNVQSDKKAFAAGLAYFGFYSATFIFQDVTFDGLSATPEWIAVQTFFIFSFPSLTYKFLNGAVIADTLGLIAVPLAFAGIYWFFAKWMFRAVGRRGPSATKLIAAFVFSLIPIALARLPVTCRAGRDPDHALHPGAAARPACGAR